jgi:hypothetical protein
MYLQKIDSTVYNTNYNTFLGVSREVKSLRKIGLLEVHKWGD